ncbi:hypothetical protein M0804_001889 [Polistes exclamans]|nr:hypothetical protein M0804_001889 [Polistes exclamans]
MRLSSVVELLLILLVIAFAAYGRVIDSGLVAVNRSIRANNVPKQSIQLPTIAETTENVNRYCTCSNLICNCCRDFHIPLVQLKGPGCASLQYLQDDNLAVQLSFGDNILTSTIVNGKNPKPVCVPLPGGFSKFCGRIYSIKRDVNNHFKACLGLELQSATELEASLRVSCFRFGPDGLKLRPAEPLPVVVSEQTSEEDDDDDLFGLGSDDDDDDEEDEDDSIRPSLNAVTDSASSDVGSAEEEDEDDDDDDVLGFGALLDIITGDDETTKKPKVSTAPPLLQFTIPILTRPTTAAPATLLNQEPSNNPNDALIFQSLNENQNVDDTQNLNSIEEESNTESIDGFTQDSDLLIDQTTPESSGNNQNEETKITNKLVKLEKPLISHKIKKIGTNQNKKPSITASSINAINDDTKKKPLKKPIKDENNEDDLLDDDDDDLVDLDDDDDDDLEDDEDEEDDADADKHEEEEEEEEGEEEEENEDEKNVDLDDLDDDDDEEEDAVLSALVQDDYKHKGKKNKVVTNQQQSSHHEDDDYSIGITDFLSRKKQDGRQSRIMRL